MRRKSTPGRTFSVRPGLESAILAKSSQPIDSAKADDYYTLALGLLRIQFNAMNLTIRPRRLLWAHSYRVDMRDRWAPFFFTPLTRYEETYSCLYCSSGKRLPF